MDNEKYVISVKAKCNNKDDYEWLYPYIDKYCGYPAMSAGMDGTILFDTPEKAADWWEQNMKYALRYDYARIDKSTLGVRKIKLEVVDTIKLDGEWNDPFRLNA